MAGIYIHIPFCKKFCNYCDFHSCTSLAQKEEMLRKIADEISLRRDFISDITIDTIYIGGGTPSLCTPSELGAFIRHIKQTWPQSDIREITFEANPDDLTPQYLHAMRTEGFNRISIGIQSFIDSHLKWMNRRHNAQTAINAVEYAREAGFGNISIDLIYGISGMNIDQWEYNLTTAINLKPEHISAYHLTIEAGSFFGKQAAKGIEHLSTPEMSAMQFETMQRILKESGYEHYEISNFALPRFRSQHNSNYWNGTQYLGVGPSAHSFNGSRREWNVSNNPQYLALQPEMKHTSHEILSQTDLYNEYIMTSLRQHEGADKNIIAARFGAHKLQYFLDRTRKFIQNEVMCETDNYIYIPEQHFLISDGIISDLFISE